MTDVVLVKRSFNGHVDVGTSLGWGPLAREMAIERWRDAVVEAGGQPYGEPTLIPGEVDEDTQRFPVRITGYALITPEMADRLDAEVGE